MKKSLEAICFATSQAMPSVIFESGCKLVDAGNSQNGMGDVISKYKDLLSSRNNYVVRFVKRQTN